jgi:DNA-binding GntR family transcriptional regulator
VTAAGQAGPRAGSTAAAALRRTADGALAAGIDGDPRAWVRVANIVLDGISSGTLAGGAKVPPAPVLGAQARCAAGAVRQAVRYLAGAGFIYRLPGAGYHVRGDMASVLGQAAQGGDQ